MPDKESKYDAQLRELGCIPWKELMSAEDMKESEQLAERVLGTTPFRRAVGRKERRRLVAQGLVPHFMFSGDHLYILDEHFEDWKGPLDAANQIEALGFKNIGKDLIPTEVRKKMH